MNATARLTIDREYYELKYDDWLKHRARWRKYSIPFSCLLVLLGVGLCFVLRSQWMLGGIVAGTGIFELVNAVTYRRRWIKKCLGLTCTDKTVEIKFENEMMNSRSRNGTASAKVTSLDSVVPASKGVFLILDNGSSIYIPESAVDPPDAFQPLVQFLITTLESKASVG